MLHLMVYPVQSGLPGTCLVWREVGIVGIAALIRRVIWVVGKIAIRWVVWIWWIIGIIRIVWIWWVIWIIRIVGIWWKIRVVGKSYPIVSLILVPRLVLLGIPLSSHDARVPHDLFRWSNMYTCKLEGALCTLISNECSP